MSRSLLCTYLLCIFFAGSTRGQFLTSSFDTGIQKLPAGFRGHDIDFLTDVCVRKDRTFKDEFETTVAFRKRVDEGKAVDINSQFAVLIDESAMSHPQFSYDADEQLVRFVVSFLDKPFLDMRTIRYRDRYGRGALGHDSITVDNPDAIKPILLNPVGGGKAQEMKAARAVVLFHLKEPCGLDWLKTRSREALSAHLDDIWIVNLSTLEIYSKLSTNEKGGPKAAFPWP